MLTVKQEKFIQGLIKGKSQRQAYKAAYSCQRMKDTTIDRKACDLMKNGKITARYEELRGEAEKDAVLSAVEMRRKIIKELSDIAFKNVESDNRYHGRQDQLRAIALLIDLYGIQPVNDAADSGIKIETPQEYAR